MKCEPARDTCAAGKAAGLYSPNSFLAKCDPDNPCFRCGTKACGEWIYSVDASIADLTSGSIVVNLTP